MQTALLLATSLVLVDPVVFKVKESENGRPIARAHVEIRRCVLDGDVYPLIEQGDTIADGTFVATRIPADCDYVRVVVEANRQRAAFPTNIREWRSRPVNQQTPIVLTFAYEVGYYNNWGCCHAPCSDPCTGCVSPACPPVNQCLPYCPSVNQCLPSCWYSQTQPHATGVEIAVTHASVRPSPSRSNVVPVNSTHRASEIASRPAVSRAARPHRCNALNSQFAGFKAWEPGIPDRIRVPFSPRDWTYEVPPELRGTGEPQRQINRRDVVAKSQ
jgi:hypothetical protein